MRRYLEGLFLEEQEVAFVDLPKQTMKKYADDI